MFGPFKKKETRLEGAIDTVLTDMAYEELNTDKYLKDLEVLERLHALKTKEDRQPKLSPDQILLVGGNLLGILIIVAYEQKHVFGSKSQNFLLKPK